MVHQVRYSRKCSITERDHCVGGTGTVRPNGRSRSAGPQPILGSMNTIEPAVAMDASDRARRATAWLIRPWPPLAWFLLLAAPYLAASVVASGRLATIIMAIALVSLFAATPVAAHVVRGVASRRLRALAALVAALSCAAAWTALTSLQFAASGPDAPERARVLLAGAGAALLYLPVIWLGGGGLRLEESRGWVARVDVRWLAAIAAAEGLFWLACAWALLYGWARWKHLDVAIGWGPMSIIVLQVAGVVCAICAVRAVRHGSRIVLWPVAAGAAWLAWWHLRIAVFYLAMSGWTH
jgi:hypothetical protein